jgi:hypothetical protein
MLNDYTGKLLHQARQKELMNEADGGWRMKQAGLRKPTKWKRMLFGLLLAAALSLILMVMPSQGQSVTIGNTSRHAQAQCILSADEMHSLRAVSVSPYGVWAVRTSSGRLLGYEGGLMALQDCAQ